MKKILLLIVFSIIIPNKIFACSWTSSSFCSTSQSSSFQNDLIVYGKIVAVDNDGIDFEIIDVLRGQENKSIIRIWDGVDFDCNGTFSMAASELGKINDQLIIILPKISEKKSSWEVIGDYRRPDFFQFTPNLRVENGIVYGLISGIETYPYVEKQANYENFKNSWETNGDCSSVVLGTDSFETERVFKVLTLPNNKFKFLSNNNIEFKIRIYNLNGLKIETNEHLEKEFEIDLSKYSAGIYFVNLTYKNNRIQNFKIIKK